MAQPRRRVAAPHHTGSFPARAKAVRALAWANPRTRCWRCHLTMAERHRTHPKAYWTAGHVVDGEVDGALLAECSTCGSTSGIAIVNEKLAQRRKAERLEARRTPRTW